MSRWQKTFLACPISSSLCSHSAPPYTSLNTLIPGKNDFDSLVRSLVGSCILSICFKPCSSYHESVGLMSTS
ncbi:Uncharacterized protein HZ326_24676 [Fusarium oxysporum f. sp. albedinis]|nr:Uncharacterized protein HZ326_24676 [Fusarium oxysporum f. sp. albedinis]